MIILLLVAAVLVPRHLHHSEKSPRHPAEVETVAAREIEIEPVASAESVVPPPAAPKTDYVAPKPTNESPDFRAAVSRQMESMPICHRAGGPEGPGTAELTYTPDGLARISLSRNYAGSSVGACVARRFAGAARPFDGEPVTMKVRFAI